MVAAVAMASEELMASNVLLGLFVDRPDEVFNSHGIFVRCIILKDTSRSEIDINLWLVKEGWAFLTFYASMTTDEINILLSTSVDVRTRRSGI